MRTGIDFVDKNISYYQLTNNITFIHSRVGMGKTTLLAKIASNLSKQDNVNVYFVTEESRVNIQRKIISEYACIPLSKINEFKDKIDGTELLEKMGKSSRLVIKRSLNSNEKLETLLKEKTGEFNVIILDFYLTKKNLEYISEFKKDFNGILLVSSQLKRIDEDIDFTDTFNHIIIDRNVEQKEKNKASVSIKTENNDLVSSEIIFNCDNLNIENDNS